MIGDPITAFITFTTYGTWMPGDERGWRKRKQGDQLPQPLLADWCRDRLSEQPVLLTPSHRQAVKRVCEEHAEIRAWHIHAISVRSNHIHICVTADKKPQTVRDQFKANATRILRLHPDPITNEKVWAKGGDCEILDEDDSTLEAVVTYINEAQDR